MKVNRGQLVQALVNLLINAGDAIERRGRAGTVRLTASGDASWVTFSVEDDGQGIPAELGGNDREPVLTTGTLKDGTGLGLTLIREFVRQSEGQLHQERCAGGGSRYLIRLPRHLASSEARPVLPQRAV
jgi:C4-dicarboxylate-specific signal transduction histidine kinase